MPKLIGKKAGMWDLSQVLESWAGVLCSVSEGSLPPPLPSRLFFWRLRWVFIAACGLSLVAASGGYSSLRCVGFSLRWLLLLRSMASRHTGFSSCGAWAQ